MKIDITEEELFDLIEALENRIEWNRYSIPHMKNYVAIKNH